MSNAEAPVVIDVTDDTFVSEVLDRSDTTPVVVDLWAPWCGPCRTLGPILERVVGATDGQVVLAKVNVDENPQVSAQFRVQGIPAVYAVKDRKVVDGFVGAQGEPAVEAFVSALVPSEAERALAALIAAGDEDSLRSALETLPGHEPATLKLAALLAERGDGDEALRLLETIPDSSQARHIAAQARTGGVAATADDTESRLDALLERVKDDDAARQEFLDLLELLGPDDPRVPGYRKALTTRLF